jgi:hypothetical protein
MQETPIPVALGATEHAASPCVAAAAGDGLLCLKGTRLLVLLLDGRNDLLGLGNSHVRGQTLGV